MAQDFGPRGIRGVATQRARLVAKTPDYWRHWLARPELAPLPESSSAERAFHARLVEAPLSKADPRDLDALEDQDTADNYRHFFKFRDRVMDAVTLERFTRNCFAVVKLDAPSTFPAFIDGVCQPSCAVCSTVCDDPWTVRAAELLFRRQRVSSENGQWLCADAESILAFAQTGGFGSLGPADVAAGYAGQGR